MVNYLFLFMIIGHIIEDFVLQPVILNKLKQKSFWLDKNNYPVEIRGETSDKVSDWMKANSKIKKYRNDWMAALFIHSLSWAFWVMLPIIIFFNELVIFVYVALVVNASIHYIVDNLKANRYKINLIQDQSIHFIQIVITYCILLIIK